MRGQVMRSYQINTLMVVAAAALISSATAVQAGESRWDHNGSVIRWISDGASREARYDDVRPAISGAVSSGDVLFKGRNDNGSISGTAYVFKKGCKAAAYNVSGEVDSSGKSFELTGDAPVFEKSGCSVARYDSTSSNATLKFTLIEDQASVAADDIDDTEKADAPEPDQAEASSNEPKTEDRAVYYAERKYTLKLPAEFKVDTSNPMSLTNGDGVTIYVEVHRDSFLDDDDKFLYSPDDKEFVAGATSGKPFRLAKLGSTGVVLFGKAIDEPGKLTYVHERRLYDCGVDKCALFVTVTAPVTKRAYIESFMHALEESTEYGFETAAPGQDVESSKMLAELARDIDQMNKNFEKQRQTEAVERQQRDAARQRELDSQSVVFEIKSEDRHRVDMQFYSSDYKTIWPGRGRVYYLYDSRSYTYRLGCKPGQKICYGAWRIPNASITWGVGRNGSTSCDKCCTMCGGNSGKIVLMDGGVSRPVASGNNASDVLGAIIGGVAAGAAIGSAVSGRTYGGGAVVRPQQSPPYRPAPRGSGISQ